MVKCRVFFFNLYQVLVSENFKFFVLHKSVVFNLARMFAAHDHREKTLFLHF